MHTLFNRLTPHPPQAQAAPWRVPLAALCVLTALALVAPRAQAAGAVELRFVQPEQFMDIGRSHFDREDNLRTLGKHFELLGRALPEGQHLQVEVLDVDLAGEIWPHTPREVRVLRGGVDWPRISLRYTLRAGDRVIAQGEDQLSDASYLFTRRRSLEHQPLPYERRMLDLWFKERFETRLTASGR